MTPRALLLLWLLHAAFSPGVSGRSRTLKGFQGVYCGEEPLGEVEAGSAVECGRACMRSQGCVGSSFRPPRQCLLHPLFCGAYRKIPEVGAFYTELTWECFHPACYYMPPLQTPMTKAAADSICAGLGAHLLAIETEQENERIVKLVYGKGTAYNVTEGSLNRQLWLDLVDEKSWGHSGEDAKYTNWGYNQPSNKDQLCATIRPDRTWGDRYCDEHFAFICEK